MSTLSFERLTITNFKGFSGTHEFELSRAPGLYYVSGRNELFPELGANGVGKSTLWDALFWVLFNKTIRDSRPANAIVPWDDEKASSSVSLHFKRGMDYILTRTRKPNTLSLTRRGKTIEIPQEDVALTIGVNEETFRRTVVLGQFGSLFLDLGPEQQAKMFSEALDLNVWLKAAEIASQRRRDTDRSLEQLGRAVAASESRVVELKQLMLAEEAAAAGFDREKAAQVKQLEAKLAENWTEITGLLETVPKPAGASKKMDVVAMLEAQITELRQSQRRLARAIGDREGQLGAIRSQLSDLRDQQRGYRDAIASSGECPECGQKTPTSHLKSKLADLVQKHGRATNDENVAKADVADLTKELSDVEITLKKIEAVVRSGTEKRAKRSILERDLKRLSETENHHDAQLTHLKIRRQVARDDGKRLTTELETAESLAKMYEFWGKAFKEIRLSIIDAVLRELEMAVTRHVSALGLVDWRVEFQTERQTQSGSVSIAFTVLLYPPDATEPVRFESYSGGESQRLQLAMAFGLSEVLLERAGVSPSCEILDEPTRGLSGQGVDDLLEHLAERARELNRAVYFCDHHSLDRGAFDDVITIIKDKEGSHIQ